MLKLYYKFNFATEPEQFSQNIQQQRKDELTQQSQRERKLMKMFEENRIVK
ncbi:hypothetical protein RO950_08305 [Staphylococcus haemolyticus]|uniref:Uncharacterized protein n=1 Tax=Staphylococcus haemolyticus TaxID=1283 RepID=A0ABU3IHH7_STAHA|nr:hypothetical protein [Staphylococcus haemolyticus]MBF2287245.1 hypothetical protein [Staphylococcus haemolyticus]MBF2301100.1 hypothetical protein [Staphylococcus haemolyticus]MBW3857078.1 hypothetical protein [Staphylococcus haemolyticus]MCC3715764.1 hypothetical protein [Staphylococcus haemolyticus]MDT4242901.1 hypothetical protein [Staphylococcus haemolyticus]